jgi:catechol 2,3-dioxygenase-like lactoylglutathione lyase family enzyme
LTHLRADHFGFSVSDLERSIVWWTRFLEREPMLVQKTWDAEYTGTMVGYPGCVIDWAYFELPGGARLELVRYVEPAPDAVDMETYNIGNGHLCIVVDDIHADFDRMRHIAELRSDAPVRIPAGPKRGRVRRVHPRPRRDHDPAAAAA